MPTRNPALAQRNANIIEDYLAGQRQDQLAKKYSLTQGRISAIIKAHVEAVITPASKELLQTEIDRLDKYLAALEPHVQRGSARHIEVALRVGERRAKLLGLDKAERLEVTHVQKTQAEADLEAMLAEASAMNEAKKQLAQQDIEMHQDWLT